MKNRLRKLGSSVLLAAGLITTCGLTYSCSDDYDLVDKRPSWLGSSIYHWLQKPTDNASYTNYVRLIDDLDYSEVLGKTGSKTLFVADDAAFEEFFKSNDPKVNPWGVKSYEELSLAQKKILLFGSMLDNAYLLEMLSSTSATSESGKPLEGRALRNKNSLTVQDSVTLFSQALEETSAFKFPENNVYWKRFKEMDASQLSRYALMMDNTAPAMLHFIYEQLQQNNITDEDVQILTGNSSATIAEKYIFDKKIIDGDITCENGYVHKMNGVLTTPSNMASVIAGYNNVEDPSRSVKLFNRILDRFNAPVYSLSATSEYKRLNPGTTVDSVFVMKYISQPSRTATDGLVAWLYVDGGKFNSVVFGSDLTTWGTASEALRFDPGWNAYRGANYEMENDMAVMFIPTDQALHTFFYDPNGGGSTLIEQFGDIDSIRLEIMASLVNNHMQASFNSTVPSKFGEVMDDMGDPIGINKSDILETVVANNGVVYITDRVYLPVDYNAVSTPALFRDNMRIINYAVQHYYGFKSYLQSMDSKYSFIIPTDDVLTYIDPASVATSYYKEYEFYWDSGKNVPQARVWLCDRNGGNRTLTADGANIENRLIDLLNCHIIVHDTTDTRYLQPDNFYKTKGGSMIYTGGADGDIGLTLYGGHQMDINESITLSRIYDYTKTNGNGKTYISNAAVQPALNTVYEVLSTTPEFKAFYDLLVISDGPDADKLYTEEEIYYGAIDPYFIETDKDKDSAMTKETEWAKYHIFVVGSTNWLKETKMNVQFFNNYNYTVYVPTEAAVKEAIKNGLPTWKMIAEEQDMKKKGEMIAQLNRFVRYHFQDNSLAISANTDAFSNNYETATVDTETGRFFSLEVSGGVGQMRVKDRMNNTCNVTSLRNIMARDLVLDGQKINASSAVVIHQIDGYLDNGELSKNK